MRRGGFAHNKDFAKHAGLTETTLYNLLGGKDAAGKTLAKLQRAGVRLTPTVIASLDA